MEIPSSSIRSLFGDVPEEVEKSNNERETHAEEEEGEFGSTLPFPDKTYGRDQELNVLHTVYDNLLRSKPESANESDDSSPLSRLNAFTDSKAKSHVNIPAISEEEEDGNRDHNTDIPDDIQHLVTTMMNNLDMEDPQSNRKNTLKVPLVLISGYSGCGKTKLVHTFLEQVDYKAKQSKPKDFKPCYCFAGKCEFDSGGSAYSALVQAVNGFCEEIGTKE